MDINSPEIRRIAIEFYKEILSIPSPVGHTVNLIYKIKNDFEAIGFKSLITPTGKLFVHLPGQTNKHVLFLIHTDNIGLAVKYTKENKIYFVDLGTISLTNILNFRCTIHSSSGTNYPGKIVPQASSKIYDVENVDKQEINHENISIRLLDYKTTTKDNKIDFESLGIESGDIISLDSRFELLPNGNIVSCGQDNKAGILSMYMACQQLFKNNIVPNYNVTIGFNNSEETGEPIAIPDTYPKFDYCVAIDAVPRYEYLDLNLNQIFIGRNDKAGFYSSDLVNHITKIAKGHDISFKKGLLDRYASDATVKAMKEGWDVPRLHYGYALDDAHQLEQTNIDAILNCAKITWHLLTDMPFERGNI